MKVPTYKSFYRTGELSDLDAAGQRGKMEASLLDEMEQKGYVPVLGLGPYYTRQYDYGSETMQFHLTIHGVYVGKDYAPRVVGVDVFTGQKIKKNTPQNK